MIYIYPSLGDSFSMRRYLSGLEEGLNELKLPYQLVQPSYEGRTLQRLFSKYVIYPIKAFKSRNEGDEHIIVSERYSFLVPFLVRKSVIIVCHDLHTLYAEARVGFLNRWFYKILLKLMIQANSIICVSQHTKDDLLQRVRINNPSKIRVVHNGLEAFWTTAAKEVGNELLDPLFEKSQVILSVGTDAWYKNFRLALEVIEQLPKEYHLLRVGEIGVDNESRIESLSLNSRVTHFKYLKDKELKSAYGKSLCLIFPSKSEGFGWPALEAIAAGGEVVTTGFGSIAEVCKNEVKYAVNKKEMIQAISRLKMKKTEENKKRDFAKGYSWTRTVIGILS